MIFYILLNLSLLNVAICLKSQDFCFIPINSSNKYVCELSNSELRVKCGLDMCTRDKTGCRDYEGWHYLIKKLRHKKLKEKQIKMRKLFIDAIKPCPKYSWNKTNICVNSHRCYYKQSMPIKMMFDSVNYVKLVTCPCQGKFSYKCGKDFCAVNKQSCEGLVWQKVENTDDAILKRIEACAKIR